nr:hypothetical protein BaRGS_033478 [Batillaria attramentaria]
MHPEDPVSFETQQTFNKIVNVYLLTLFCLISTPTNILNMIVFFKHGFVFHTALPFVPEMSLSGKYYNTYYFMINVQQLFIYINSSFNFFVYYYFGSKYRNTVRTLFCGKPPPKSKDSNAQLSTIVSNTDVSVTMTEK